MNLYKRYLSDITRFNGISVSIFDRIPEDISPHVYKLLQKQSASGWYDKERDCVCLYGPNIVPDETDINANVTFLYIREKGLKSLLKDRYEDFCMDVVKDFYPQARMLEGKECEDMAMEYLNGLSPDDKNKWRRIAVLACRYSYFPMHDRMIAAVANGHHANLKKTEWEARINNDHIAVDRKAKEFLGNMASERVNVSFGRCADPFLRVGYPEAELRLRSPQVREFLRDNGLLDEGSPNLSEIIQNPLAIVKGENRKNDGKIPLNILITDYFVPAKGFLSFGLDSPESILAGYGEGVQNVSIRSARFMSEFALLSTVSKSNGDNIFYLKQGKSHGYEISSYLGRMEGRSFSELGKKGGDGNTPVYSPLSESRRLIIATNIVNNFKNPMASDTRRKIFGGILFEDNLSRRQETLKELKSMSEKPVVGYSAPAPVKENKTRSARTVYYTDKDFPAAVIRKLGKAGISNAFDIMTYGKERFSADFGLRAFQSAVEFLDKHNLSFMNHSVVKRIDESEIKGKDISAQLAVVRKDMYNAFSGLGQENISKAVSFPRRMDGSYVEGAGAFTLIAKSMALARWRDCNIFLTREEAMKLDIQINSTAVPTYVAEKGTVKAYFNFSDTSFATERAESFAMLKEDAVSRTPLVDGYARSYITLLSGTGCAEKDYDAYNIEMIDAAYARNCSQRKDLKNNGSFTHHLDTTLQERLARTYDEGFMKGKAEGINLMAEFGQKKARQEQNRKKDDLKPTTPKHSGRKL